MGADMDDDDTPLDGGAPEVVEDFFFFLSSFFLLSAVLDVPSADFFDVEPTFKQSYASLSGEICVILRRMLETFESKLPAPEKKRWLTNKHTAT